MSYIDGIVQKYLFFNEENSYSVIKLKISDTDESELIHYEPTIIVCGFFPKLDNITKYRFYGEVTNHAKYGLQYNAISFERIIDNSYEGLIDYLSSSLFFGIGRKKAELIIENLGLNALDLIAEDKNVLAKVPKITKKQRDEIFEQVVSNKEMEKTLVWLYGFDVSPKMAMRIFNHYGIDTIKTIKENPYILMEHIEGIGFKRADDIGLRIGFKYDSPLRISAVIYYLLNEYMNKFGDTYLEEEQLLEYTKTFLENNNEKEIDLDKIKEQLVILIGSGKIIRKNHALALSYLYYSEEFLARKLLKLSQISTELEGFYELDKLIEDFQVINDIKYTASQIKAITKAMNSNLLVVTGGPGTGKTTVIKGIIDIYMMIHNNSLDKDKLKLAAPTGKAAKRLSEATDLPATTIHKLLGYDYEGNFKYDQTNNLEAKILIIDEASMLDVVLAKRLFSAIDYSTKVIVVGDANQLPSVGPGDVLNSIINSNLFDVVELDVIHRQAFGSKIISLAYDILAKEINVDIFKNYHDKEFIKTFDNLISIKLIERIKTLIDSGYNLLEDIQILIPVYKGFNGIDRINTLIQQSFNHANKDYKIRYKDKEFWYNDKVLQLVNQPEDNIMNGDQGYVVGITLNDELIVDFSGNIVKYSTKDLENLSLAYAISIHKSQGSEFKVVMLLLSKAFTIMLKRKLMYTAVTRAKEKLIIVGDFEAYKRGVLGVDRQRKTLLPEFFMEHVQSFEETQVKISDFL